jgi:hypothetical protein
VKLAAVSSRPLASDCTESLLPSNSRALPRCPAVHSGPLTRVADRPLPDPSKAAVPLCSSKAQAATAPGASSSAMVTVALWTLGWAMTYDGCGASVRRTVSSPSAAASDRGTTSSRTWPPPAGSVTLPDSAW